MTEKQIIRSKSADLTTGEPAPRVEGAEFQLPEVPEVETKVESIEDNSIQQYLLQRHNITEDRYPTELKDIISTLENYVKVMKRGANPTPEVQGLQAGKLYLCYVKALRSATDTILFMDAVMWYFNKEKEDAFFSEMPFRGLHMHKFGTADQMFFFNHITSFCQVVCDIKTRSKKMREIDSFGVVNQIRSPSYEKHKAGLTSYIQFYRNY